MDHKNELHDLLKGLANIQPDDVKPVQPISQYLIIIITVKGSGKYRKPLRFCQVRRTSMYVSKKLLALRRLLKMKPGILRHRQRSPRSGCRKFQLRRILEVTIMAGGR
jgi:hypothetical protein